MSAKREKLIETALELFAKNGFHATGIDTILAHAGVAKKTLYTHFRTKEELILAALRQHDGQFRNHFMKNVDALADTPVDKLLAIFDVTKAWFSQNNFYGCMFINAIGEYSEKDSAIREICKEYKRLMRNYMTDLAEQAGVEKAEELANELSLLLEGAIVTAQVSEISEQAADTAKRAAKRLIDAY